LTRTRLDFANLSLYPSNTIHLPLPVSSFSQGPSRSSWCDMTSRTYQQFTRFTTDACKDFPFLRPPHLALPWLAGRLDCSSRFFLCLFAVASSCHEFPVRASASSSAPDVRSDLSAECCADRSPIRARNPCPRSVRPAWTYIGLLHTHMAILPKGRGRNCADQKSQKHQHGFN
jgi:hypothetical protein